MGLFDGNCYGLMALQKLFISYYQTENAEMQAKTAILHSC
jgi:hypothetical protein